MKYQIALIAHFLLNWALCWRKYWGINFEQLFWDFLNMISWRMSRFKHKFCCWKNINFFYQPTFHPSLTLSFTYLIFKQIAINLGSDTHRAHLQFMAHYFYTFFFAFRLLSKKAPFIRKKRGFSMRQKISLNSQRHKMKKDEIKSGVSDIVSRWFSFSFCSLWHSKKG